MKVVENQANSFYVNGKKKHLKRDDVLMFELPYPAISHWNYKDLF